MDTKPAQISLIIAFTAVNLMNPPFLAINAVSDASGKNFNAYGDSLIAANQPLINAANAENKAKTIKTVVTAYSSAPEETDETPFITASGNHVRDGIAASNFLPMGTKFRLPELFGGKVFVVDDKMNSRYNDRIDIWFNSKQEAKNFGKKTAKIEIL